MINTKLLNIICCPETKAPLVLYNDFLISTDKESRRKYKIENDVPILLIDESEVLELKEWEEIMKKTKALKNLE